MALMATRRRRSAEAAREAILDAAERRLLDGGPDRIRLQDVAADVGVSHPAVLHHFGSRDALVQSVVDRALRRLEASLMTALAVPAPDGAALLDAVYATLVDGGHGRLLAWLLLSGGDAGLDLTAARKSWRAIIDATHAGRAGATREDTAFTVVLAAFAVFGQALAGAPVLAMAGLPARSGPRFRRWLAELMAAHMMKR